MTQRPEAVVQLPTRNAELEDKIAAVRAARESLAAQREARAQADELASKLASEELAFKGEQAVEAAEAEHGAVDKKIRVVQTDMGVVIVKRAHPAVFKRFIDRGKHSMQDLEELARKCLVYPTLPEWEAMCNEQTAIINRTADAIAWLAGIRADDVSAKP